MTCSNAEITSLMAIGFAREKRNSCILKVVFIALFSSIFRFRVIETFITILLLNNYRSTTSTVVQQFQDNDNYFIISWSEITMKTNIIVISNFCCQVFYLKKYLLYYEKNWNFDFSFPFEHLTQV